MHNFDRVISVLFAFKLNEAVALVLIGNFVPGKVDIHNRATLDEELPKEIFSYFLIEIAHVDGCLLVSLIERGNE